MTAANPRLDRLYQLLPVIQRMRDQEQGQPLRALLQVIAEQVNLVEDDIARLYENWFIETCEDWVVPYLGDLVGYRPVHEAGEPGDAATAQGRLHNKILIPRREVANTLRYRRRKGSLALLESLAMDVAGWPARAVEFYRLLGVTQSLNHLQLQRGRSVDLRHPGVIAELGGPFDSSAHTVDIRRIDSSRPPRGLYHRPNVGLFACRLRAYPASQALAFHVDSQQGHCAYTFSPLGNDQPLFAKPQPFAESALVHPGSQSPVPNTQLPLPISRRNLKDRPADYYGIGKSFCIWIDDPSLPDSRPLPLERIVAADLSGWAYQPKRDQVAVDPVSGRIAIAVKGVRKQPKAVWVSYHYGFAADLGGGEYRRSLSPIGPERALYTVGKSPNAAYPSLALALAQWRKEADAGRASDAVVEILDNGVYDEQPAILVNPGERLELRAAQGVRPQIRVLDENFSRADGIAIYGPEASGGATPGSVTLDGLLIAGRGIRVGGTLHCLHLRHCTLVPGWNVDAHCEPEASNEPSIELTDTSARLAIAHCIVGSIEVNQDKAHSDPLSICIADSILDATSNGLAAVSDADCAAAHAVLTLRRCTVIGAIHSHAIQMAENCLFTGSITVVRRQIGCLRFCHVPWPSRTPRRYHCQPDLALAALAEDPALQNAAPEEIGQAQANERLRLFPQFDSTRYGTPGYCRLACSCAEDIGRGADDEAEMGAYHDLFQPQREANLRARLNEYTPAGCEAGLIYLN